MTSLWCHDVSIRGTTALVLLFTVLGIASMTEVTSAQTIVIPSLSVSETYDSNVFWAPKSQLSGVTPEDFITTILPQVNVAHTNQFITGSLSAGASIMRYLNNPNLD